MKFSGNNADGKMNRGLNFGGVLDYRFGCKSQHVRR